MAGSLNKLCLIGNLGGDPDLRYMPDGTPKTSFSVAVNETWTTAAGEKQEKTDWFHIVAWRKLAETCSKYLHKGSKVYVEGPLHERRWTDPTTHEEKKMVQMDLRQMLMLDKKGDSSNGNGDGSDEAEVAAAAAVAPGAIDNLFA